MTSGVRLEPKTRLERLRERLLAEGLDALLVTDPVNLAYLTSFDDALDASAGNAAFVTVAAGPGSDAGTGAADVAAAPAGTAVFVAGILYAEAVAEAAAGTPWEVLVSNSCSGLSSAEVAEMIAASGAQRIAIEDTLAYREYAEIAAELGKRAVVTSGLVVGIRAVKEPEEIERIARAQRLTDNAFAHIVDLIRPGVTEKEIALGIDVFFVRHGAQAAFPTIVASGRNAAKPHAVAGGRSIQKGDLVTLDFGARLDGYCSDMTRTVSVGAASDHQRELYHAVLAANQAGIAAIHEGAYAAAVDAAARSVLAEAGLEGLFTHGLGHGVGREVHELPVLGQKNTSTLLECGHVATVEPGVYEPGVCGVRIEDLVVVGKEGARVLTGTPKDLIEL